MNLLSKIPQYWKAVVGFLAPAASVIALSALSSSDGGSTITKAEWITAATAAVLTSAGVAATKNQPKPAPPDNDEAA